MLRFTLKQTVFINVIFVLLILVGFFALYDVPIERYPNVNMGQVSITTFWPGASPRDVETMVTREIEDALDDLDDVEYIRSTSNRNRSRVVVKFIDDVDYRMGYDDLRLKVLSILDELPDGVDPPEFEVIDSDKVYPVVSVNLGGDRENRVLTLIGEELESSLRQVYGVKEVILQGEYTREYHVVLDPNHLVKFGVTFDQVAQAMSDANVAVPAGDMTTPTGEYVLLVDEQYRTREQIEATAVRSDADGSLLTVGDLMADAYMSHRDPVVISSVNGENCISLQVIKTWDGNALDIRKAVDKLVEDYRPVLEREGVFVVMTQDSTIEISDSISTLGMNLFVGIILVFILIWLFMGFRNAGLTAIGIPFAFLVTVTIMWLFNYSLNEITLFSFVLISGIVVDDAIVVIENIYRHLQMGKPLHDAVVDGTAEVFMPVVSATMTTVFAFLPMLIMTGTVGQFFAQIPKAVSFALLASVLECLFILPIHYMDFGPRNPKQETEEDEFKFMRLLRKPVDRLVKLTLRFRWTTIGLVSVTLVAALIIAGLSFSGKVPLIRVQLFPDDYGRYIVEMEGPVGTSLENIDEKLSEISRVILADGDQMVQNVAGYAGFIIDETYLVTFDSFIGHLIVTLPSQSKRRFEDYPKNDPLAHLDYIRGKMKPFEEQGFTVRVRPQQDGPPTGKDVNVRAVGSNSDAVAALADRMKKFLQEDPRLKDELIDRADDRGKANRLFSFHVRHDRAAEYGITPRQISGLTAAALNGRYLGEFRDEDEQVDLKLKLIDLETPEAALDIPLMQHATGSIRLGDLNTTNQRGEPGFLNRFQGERSINISANLKTGSNLSTVAVVEIVRKFYREIQADYPGATLNFTGEFEDTRRSFISLAYAFVIATLLIYMTLATQFQSYLQPLIVISAVVFAFIGVIFGIFLTRTLFSINNMIAMVGVVGVVVNDSLVLIEFINKLYRGGMSRREAILEGTRVRLRPILLTTLTTSLAFLPMAIGIPQYSLVWGSMASTFVTGLCTATFLTLFVIPVQWDLLTEMKERFAAKKKGAS